MSSALSLHHASRHRPKEVWEPQTHLCEARETRHGQHHHVLVVQAKEAPLPQFSHREHLLLLIYCQDDLRAQGDKRAAATISYSWSTARIT
eukprot:1161142-Pelagomonas_calceolata.AAC.5